MFHGDGIDDDDHNDFHFYVWIFNIEVGTILKKPNELIHVYFILLIFSKKRIE